MVNLVADPNSTIQYRTVDIVLGTVQKHLIEAPHDGFLQRLLACLLVSIAHYYDHRPHLRVASGEDEAENSRQHGLEPPMPCSHSRDAVGSRQAIPLSYVSNVFVRHCNHVVDATSSLVWK